MSPRLALFRRHCVVEVLMFRSTLRRFQCNVVCNTRVHQISRRPFSRQSFVIDMPVIRRYCIYFRLMCNSVFHSIDSQLFNDTSAVRYALSALLRIILPLRSVR